VPATGGDLLHLGLREGGGQASLYISLHEWNIISPEKPFVGARNFQMIFADPRFGRAAISPVRYVAVGIPLQLVLGLLLALTFQRITRVPNMTFQDQGGPLSSALTLVLHVCQLGFQLFKMGEAAATAVLFTAILLITLLQIKVLSKPVEY